MASIVVVGAGVAGLTCAWRLARAGHDVEVLEREDAPGGRMRSEQRGEFVIDRGAQFAASGYRNLHRVAGALGIESRLRPLACSREAVLHDGRLEAFDTGSLRELLRSPLLSAGGKARLARILPELVRHARRLDPYRPERAAPLDREDMATYLRRTAGEEAFERLLGPAFAATFDTAPQHLSAAFALLALRLVLGGFRLEAFEGGMGLLTRSLAERVSVRTGCEVIRVETASDGSRVRYRTRESEGGLLADGVVVAVPGTRVPHICPGLTGSERAFFSQVRYGRGVIVHLLLEKEPQTLPYYGVAFRPSEALELYGLAVDHHKPGVAPRGAGLVNAALTAEAAARLWWASDEAIVERVVESLAWTPVGRLAPADFVVHRWDPMLPQFHPGYLGHLRAFLARRDRSRRLAFAGDYLLGPYAEMALTSGMRAASEIAREIGALTATRRDPAGSVAATA